MYFFQTLEFLPYPSQHWNSDLIYSKYWNSGLISSKHWNMLTLFLLNIGIVTLFFQTLELSPYPSKHLNNGHIISKLEF